MSNALTANLGLRVADDYLAMLGGGVPRHPLRRLRPEQHLFQRTRRGRRAQAGLAHRARRQPDLPAHRHYPDPGRLPLFHRRLPRTRRRARLATHALRHGDTWDSGSYKQRNQFNLLVEPGPRRLRQPLSFRLLQRFLRRQEPRRPIAVRLLQYLGAVEATTSPGRGRPPPTTRSRATRTLASSCSGAIPAQRPAQRHLTLSVSMPLGSSSRAPTLQRHGYPALRRQPWRQPANRAERYAGRRALPGATRCPPTATARSPTPPGTARCRSRRRWPP